MEMQMASQESGDLREIGVGINVMESTDVVEGRILFLDSPQEVLSFVAGEAVDSSIVISRGGTTTFMAPALASGVRGLITLQGSPESHLGILSREFGIPCVMSVAFTEGVQTSRGETIPADGTLVRLEVSSVPDGRVLLVSEATS
jgi:phosphoenolpyruvate-protein kinase (PTS system EI component)